MRVARAATSSLPVRLDEPATTITDYAIAALCAAFAVGTARAASRADAASVWVWAMTFLPTGAAAALGGTAHGFASRMPPARQRAVWRATLYSLSATAFAMLAAVALTLGGPSSALPRAAVLAAGVAKLVVTARLIAARAEFGDVLRDYGSSMALLAVAQAWAYAARQAPSAPWMIAAVVLSFAGGAVQHFRLAPHPRFNHNDLYHVVQMGALYLFYRGGVLLGA